ncbi:MAG: formimidoylglutamate deiminase [Gemmatimonadetes bacterium]|nr:formimidoylglutamate deiminase [Gemmatimonadota bacterium]
MPTLQPDFVYLGGRFLPERAVRYAGGQIEAVVPVEEAGPVDERLEGRAIMPGFVNAHSHAFQRLLRGSTQWRPISGGDSSFWSWRASMYALAGVLSPEDLYSATRMAFLEMMLAGFTAVGEFHYLRNQEDGTPYDDPNELAHRVLAAAHDVGIRITLLNGCYATGGIDRPLERRQRRFATSDLDAYIASTVNLAASVAHQPTVTIGLGPHSVRAVPRPWLPEIAAWARERQITVHMHIAEQPAEVATCVARWGARVVNVLEELGVLGANFTGVHAIHLDTEEIRILGTHGATVCACPTTERDLGDGIVPAAALLAAGVELAVGSDSQTVIDPLEEMRLLEYHERLRRLERAVLGTPLNEELYVAPRLIHSATAGGARSLRVNSGSLEPGTRADFLAIELTHPSLGGVPRMHLPAALALCAPAAVVTDVWVQGERRVRERQHPRQAEIMASYRETARRVREKLAATR